MTIIGRIGDYSIMIMCELALYDGLVISSKTISRNIKVSYPTVMKILKILSKHKLVMSTKGVNGGYTLAKAPKNITLLDIIIAVDGVTSLVMCNHSPSCQLAPHCKIKNVLSKINDIFQKTLRDVTLSHFIKASV